MSHNSFGHLLRMTTFGESHGPAVGCVVDGCPPGLDLCEADIQPFLDARRPGTSRYTSQRREADRVRILSGVFTPGGSQRSKTTGTPLCLMIENTDQRSKDYDDIAGKFRPGHADFTYLHKYGLRDHRGGGRASARETAARVAAGAVARKIIPNVAIDGAVVQLGPHKLAPERRDWAQARRNPLFCPDAEAAPHWEAYLDGLRKSGSSCGAVIEIRASGVGVGWGAPVYGKLDQDIAGAMMSINAVKAVEIGAGLAAAALTGEENADELRIVDGAPVFAGNNAGGILGGIATGQDIICRFAVKPTSSILKPLRTIDAQGQETTIVTRGRHDPCVGIRAVPVGEAMMALVLADHYLRHRAQCDPG